MILANRVTNPGSMRTPITLQSTTITKQDSGALTESWTNFASNPNVYAKVTYAHGPESVSSDAMKSVSRATILIRYRSDVNATHAILLNSKRWKIIGTPDNIQNRNEYLEFQVELIEGTV